MRVVLDTNTLVSALLFGGVASRLVPLWQPGRLTPVVSRAVLEEYLRVLAYPKFRLTPAEIRSLIEEEVLPFAETVVPRRRLRVVQRDPDDDKFLECAVAGRARFLLTGDQDLRSLDAYRGIMIRSAREFLESIR